MPKNGLGKEVRITLTEKDVESIASHIEAIEQNRMEDFHADTICSFGWEEHLDLMRTLEVKYAE